MLVRLLFLFFFFFNDTATTEIYTLSLHDALPISPTSARRCSWASTSTSTTSRVSCRGRRGRSEEHTSELQSPDHLVCRLLLEKKKERRVDACGPTARAVPQRLPLPPCSPVAVDSR